MKRKIRDFYLIKQIFKLLFLNIPAKCDLMPDYLQSKKV
jgi:hypothetical protein